MKLENMIAAIAPLDESAMQAARARQDRLTKPPGSLGRLEEIAVRVAGITGQPLPILEKKAILVLAGDHGVVEEGVSAYPQEVTGQMVRNFLAGGAAINVLARHIGARVVVVDMGIAAEIPKQADLLVKKVARGTANIARGPAMTREQALEAVISGAQVAEAQLERGLNIVATGDMGIGNTTPSAAIASALTGRAPEQIVGRGTGVDDRGLERKVNVVRRALLSNRPDPTDGMDVLAKVGGFEIAGLTGVILAAAANRIPIVIDGFISTAAAMIAVTLQPAVSDYLIAGHCSQERGHRIMLEWLGLEPFLELNLRLGEGSGAVLAISLVEAACKTLVEMATFEEAGVADKVSL